MCPCPPRRDEAGVRGADSAVVPVRQRPLRVFTHRD